VTRRDLGVTGEIELAEMTALPPFAQMLADMDRLGSLGSRCGCLYVHGENLPCGFHPFHYLRGNETWTYCRLHRSKYDA
jgi:hypothetical protein